ncbi:MAG: alpha/beta hydrolase [Acidobacteriota bacterium]|nr:alpha/beta hydrolase [Acidobacteriota bacterium]
MKPHPTPSHLTRIGLALLLAVSACAGPEPEPAAEPAVAEEDPVVASPVAGVSFRMVESNGLTMRVAEAGEGPLVIFAHGFPESWYSWRHQLPAIAAAGYRAVAPDMRGYGSTSAPREIEAYDTPTLCRDLIGLIDHYGEEQAVLVGHDWGAAVVWNCSLIEAARVRGVAALSVPYGGRGETHPIESMKEGFGENFFYMLYFQELDEDGNGIADAEFGADPRTLLKSLYTSPDTLREPPTITDPLRSAGGWIGRLGMPTEFPPWFSQVDLDYYVGEFERAGFRGGINYYRNIGRSWELTPELAGARVTPPALFIAGEQDGVIGGATKEQLEASLGAVADDLRGVHLIPATGHWVQQEKGSETNDLLISFLTSLD